MSTNNSRARAKPAETAPWLSNDVHVWHTKGGELTVINLRDPTESLREAAPTEKAALAAEAGAPPPCSTPVNTARETGPTPKAVLSAAVPCAPHRPPLTGEHSSARLGGCAATARATGDSGTSAALAAPTPPWEKLVPEKPSEPPAPREGPKAAAFEFIAGTNIPGRGVLNDAGETEEKSPALAIFHDPLWGGGTGTWSTSPTTTNRAAAPPSAALTRGGSGASHPLFDVFATVPRPRPASEPPLALPPVPPVVPEGLPGLGGAAFPYARVPPMVSYGAASPAASPALLQYTVGTNPFAVNAPLNAYLAQQQLYARLAAMQVGMAALPPGFAATYNASAAGGLGGEPLTPPPALSASTAPSVSAGSSALGTGTNVDAKPFVPQGSA